MLTYLLSYWVFANLLSVDFRAFVRLTPHITLRKKNLLFKMIEKCIVSKFNNTEAVGIKHQGLNAEATVALQLNQGERKKSDVYLFFLDFLVLLGQAKEH